MVDFLRGLAADDEKAASARLAGMFSRAAKAHMQHADIHTQDNQEECDANIYGRGFVAWVGVGNLLGHDMMARQRHQPLAEHTTPGLNHVVSAPTAAVIFLF